MRRPGSVALRDIRGADILTVLWVCVDGSQAGPFVPPGSVTLSAHREITDVILNLGFLGVYMSVASTSFLTLPFDFNLSEFVTYL